MHFATLAKFIGLLLMVFSLSQLPPVVVDLIYREGQTLFFLIAFVITLTLGLLLYFPFKTDKHILRIRESIFLVVSFWLVLSLIATIPFMLSPQTNLSFVDSLFESMSGLSTTGATIITGLDELPKAILYYRQQLQWFGGMGIIVLAVAILPIFGISNLGLFQAETSNLSTDRITPQTRPNCQKFMVNLFIFNYYLCDFLLSCRNGRF
jgi:trk system potassium uptake protein TrkH